MQKLILKPSDLILGDPNTWDGIWDALPSVKPRVWLDSILMDNFILHHWLEAQGQAPIYVVDVQTIGLFCAGSTGGVQMLDFRKRFNLPVHGEIEQKPVALVVFRSQHYFVVVFDYSSSQIYVLGRSGSQVGYTMSNWEEWNGPVLWLEVAVLFGWMLQEEADIEELNWLQVCIILFYLNTYS
jgi:hypothetical protein